MNKIVFRSKEPDKFNELLQIITEYQYKGELDIVEMYAEKYHTEIKYKEHNLHKYNLITISFDMIDDYIDIRGVDLWEN